VRTTQELLTKSMHGLRVVWAAEGLRAELEPDNDPASMILADLMVRHAERAERAARALRMTLHQAYVDESERDDGGGS